MKMFLILALSFFLMRAVMANSDAKATNFQGAKQTEE